MYRCSQPYRCRGWGEGRRRRASGRPERVTSWIPHPPWVAAFQIRSKIIHSLKPGPCFPTPPGPCDLSGLFCSICSEHGRGRWWGDPEPETRESLRRGLGWVRTHPRAPLGEAPSSQWTGLAAAGRHVWCGGGPGVRGQFLNAVGGGLQRGEWSDSVTDPGRGKESWLPRGTFW